VEHEGQGNQHVEDIPSMDPHDQALAADDHGPQAPDRGHPAAASGGVNDNQLAVETRRRDTRRREEKPQKLIPQKSHNPPSKGLSMKFVRIYEIL
jgi:hypothetical protein